MKLRKVCLLLSLAMALALPVGIVFAIEDPAKEPEIDKKTVLALYKKHCVSCHGVDGKGNTRMGKKTKVKDYTDAKFIATIKDDKALEKIKKGLKDERGKFTMKPYSKKLKDPEIKVLIKYMKAFAKKKDDAKK